MAAAGSSEKRFSTVQPPCRRVGDEIAKSVYHVPPPCVAAAGSMYVQHSVRCRPSVRFASGAQENCGSIRRRFYLVFFGGTIVKIVTLRSKSTAHPCTTNLVLVLAMHAVLSLYRPGFVVFCLTRKRTSPHMHVTGRPEKVAGTSKCV